MLRNIAILTSGGDAPGMNAAIRAAVHRGLNEGLKVYGIYDGYKGLVEGRFVELKRESVSGILTRGGTMLGTARLPEFKEKAVMMKGIEQLGKHQIDGLIVIGGDGTYRGAEALTKAGVNCIGLPGTIDNDIKGTDYTIGFDTAVDTIVGAVDRIRDTSASHHRCSLVEVMGNKCGDLATFAGLATGAEILIVPEQPYDEDEIIRKLNSFSKLGKTHAIIIVCEKIIDINKLSERISAQTDYDARATILGHIQRGGSPTPRDRILSTMMAEKAVELLVDGIGGHCVCIDNEVLFSLPISEALTIEKDRMNKYYDLFDRLI